MKRKTLLWTLVFLLLATAVNAQYYNISNVSDADNLWELTATTNDMSGGWLGIAVLLTLTVMIFITLKDYPMKEAFAATAYISVILAILMRIMNLIPDFMMFIYIILTACATIVLIFNRQ